MKITYNLQVLPQRKNSRKDSEETTALKAFLADSEKKNMPEGPSWTATGPISASLAVERTIPFTACSSKSR